MSENLLGHSYDDRSMTYIPIVIISCPMCRHNIAINERATSYENWVKSYRSMFNRLATENTVLKNKVKYLSEELEQFKKACH